MLTFCFSHRDNCVPFSRHSAFLLYSAIDICEFKADAYPQALMMLSSKVPVVLFAVKVGIGFGAVVFLSFLMVVSYGSPCIMCTCGARAGTDGESVLHVECTLGYCTLVQPLNATRLTTKVPGIGQRPSTRPPSRLCPLTLAADFSW